MPADRLIHPKAGHSEKVTRLTDLEFRVWVQYILSADDFGVMRASAITLQADNDYLASKPQKTVQKAVEKVVSSGLIRTFDHQGRRYCYQHDWQDWQRVSYPRATNVPRPPDEAITKCSADTIELFSFHPGGKGRKVPKRSENIPETFSESSGNVSEKSPTTRAGTPADRLTANSNGYRQTANGSNGRTLVARRRLDAAFEGRRGLYVPAMLHKQFTEQRNHADAEAELQEFYLRVSEAYADGARKHEEPDPDMFKFWTARYQEKWPPTPAAAVADRRLPAWARQ